MNSETKNQLWKVRSKHGRAHFFKSPEALWDAACEYFEWCDTHPVYQSVIKGPPQSPVTMLPRIRAYTLKGLCVYLGCGSKYFNQFDAQLAGKTDEVSEEFMSVITTIRDAIFEQKYTAAASGELNASIIARELNLAYNAEAAHKVDTPPEPPKEQQFILWGDKMIPI